MVQKKGHSMIDRVEDRCKRICGETREHCYVNSRQQLNCIADLVINKTASISMLLGFSLDEQDKEAANENLRESISISNELSNWVKYLRIVKDLRDLSSLVLDSDSAEKRTEIRYPMPGGYETQVAMTIALPDSEVQCVIVNFSQSGAQLRCPKALDIDSLAECIIKLPPPYNNEMPCRARIKYCGKSDGDYIIGARIDEVSGSRSFNFFEKIINLLLQTAIEDN
jgi:hypothetical protein